MELHGDLQSFPLTQLVQTLESAQRTGKLDIEGHLGNFGIFFQKGRVIHAQSPYSSGLPAFFDAFLETEGTFSFASNVILPPRRITQSNTSLLMEQRRWSSNMQAQNSGLSPLPSPCTLSRTTRRVL